MRYAAMLPVLACCLVPSAAAAAASTLAPVRDAARSFATYPRDWRSIRDQHVVMQQRDYSCGAAALATVLRFYWGERVTEGQLLHTIEGFLSPEDLRDRVQNGLSISDLRRTAVEQGYLAAIGRLTPDKLAESRVPLVVAIRTRGYDHFVVVRDVIDDWVYLADPVRGNVRLPMYVFSRQWIDQAVLAVAPKDRTSSDVSQLGVTPQEVDLGWLNQQIIRTQPDKSFR